MNNFLFNRCFKPKLNARIYLVTGLLLLLLLQSAASFAQKITLNYPSTPLEQVLREIRKQSGYDIFFDQSLVGQQPPVTIKITNANVEEAMATVLKGLPLSFVINGKTISVKKPDKAVVAATRQQKITITGAVIDDNELPLAGVSVSSAAVKSVYTDGEGKFTLKDIDPLAIVRIAYTGKLTIERTALAISLMGKIMMEAGSIDLNTTIIQGQRPIGKSLGVKLDITHRKQQSLVQVLEGTIPGLVIKNNRTTTSQRFYISDGSVVPAGRYTLEQLQVALVKAFGGAMPEAEARQYARGLMDSGVAYGTTVTETTTTNNMMPELRGAGGFGAGNNAMLVVIDGFVQDGFPADYPMNNVLSVEVIRDPAETIKWGPGAASGVIVITTDGGKPGELQISYNSIFNFSGTPDNSAKALQLANTNQLLNNYLERDQIRSNRPSDLTGVLFSPARMLLEERYANRNNPNAEQIFQNSWKLLSQLSNEEQFREQQQRPFNQNQSLNISGGGKRNRFSINSSYNSSRSEALGNSKSNWGFNLRDQLTLIDNKLQIAIQVNGILRRDIVGNNLNRMELEPYQMLYRTDGSYVYDYSLKGTNAYNNTRLKNLYPGLQDYGYNPLEEARGTQNLSKGHNLNSSLNINWKLLQDLTWSTNLQYINVLSNKEKLTSKNTQYARNLYNSYYAVTKTERYEPFPVLLPGYFETLKSPLNPPIAYLPFGDVYSTSKDRENSTNLRTGLSYNHLFDQKHALNLRVGFSYFDQSKRSNANLPLYGYNSSTGTGAVLSLPPLNPNLGYSAANDYQINFNNLTSVAPIVRTPERNMSTNAALDYTYDGRLGMQAFYNESFMPINSVKIYSSTRNYNALASWALHKESFFKVPLISRLKLSAGFGEIKMASLPVNLPA